MGNGRKLKSVNNEGSFSEVGVRKLAITLWILIFNCILLNEMIIFIGINLIKVCKELTTSPKEKRNQG